MTSKRPVTHPALHAALNDGVWRDAAIAPPGAPREPQGGAEASSGTTGRGEGSDAADGRTAARSVGLQNDILAALIDTRAERDVQRSRADMLSRQLGEAERERDDLLTMKARVEARVEHVLDRWRATTSYGLMDEIRDAIRGDR